MAVRGATPAWGRGSGGRGTREEPATPPGCSGGRRPRPRSQGRQARRQKHSPPVGSGKRDSQRRSRQPWSQSKGWPKEEAMVAAERGGPSSAQPRSRPLRPRWRLHQLSSGLRSWRHCGIHSSRGCEQAGRRGSQGRGRGRVHVDQGRSRGGRCGGQVLAAVVFTPAEVTAEHAPVCH